MYYDLHIHSALSPCSDNMMTIHNIFRMAYIQGLDLIAITDHNSLKQQYLLHEVIQDDVLKGKIDFIYGVELQTKENIHILAYFQKNSHLQPIQEWIDDHLIIVDNQVDYYGHQYIFDIHDHIVDEETRLLLSSLDLNVYEVIDMIHHFGGIAVLAHVMAKRYGLYEVYHTIPQDLDYDGIEVDGIKAYRDLKKKCPFIRDELILMNSDAHQLEDINDPIHEIDQNQLDALWRKSLCKKSQ